VHFRYTPCFFNIDIDVDVVMEQLVVFITNHWALSALFGVILVAFLMNELIQRKRGAAEISPEAAVQLMNHRDALVLDLRGEAAFLEGHILGAMHLPMMSLDKKMASLQKHITQPLLVVCAMGQDSPKAALKLQQNGFQVFVLNGGVQAWKAGNLPLVKS